jgi:transcriptional regulator with XRE-family HTH domain/protein-disulfide isomerase-like protein with CxxC motif
MDLRDEKGRKELGRRIQSAIAGAGFSSLAEFADAVECSRGLIYKYINGRGLVQLDRLSAIAEVTCKPLDWFLVEDPNGSTGEVQQLEGHVDDLRERCERLEAALADERGERIGEAQAARKRLLEMLDQLCSAQRRAGDMRGLLTSAARYEDIARESGDDAALMRAKLQTGHAAFGLGQRDQAREELEVAVKLAEILRDDRVELSARQELVRVLQAGGHFDEARHEALALSDGERWWSQWAGLVALAAIDEQDGYPSLADGLLDEAEKVINGGSAPAEHVRMARAYLHSNRVNVLLARGHYEEAARAADRLHELAAEAGLPDQVREAMLDQAVAAVRLGQVDRAGELLARLREWADLSGDQRTKGLAAVFEAERLVQIGEPAQARQLATEAIELGNGTVSGQMVAEAELVLGKACLADELLEDALYHLGRSAKRAERLRLRRVQADARLTEARALLASDAPEAPEALQEALHMAQDHDFDDLTAQATELLGEQPADQAAQANDSREDSS